MHNSINLLARYYTTVWMLIMYGIITYLQLVFENNNEKNKKEKFEILIIVWNSLDKRHVNPPLLDLRPRSLPPLTFIPQPLYPIPRPSPYTNQSCHPVAAFIILQFHLTVTINQRTSGSNAWSTTAVVFRSRLTEIGLYNSLPAYSKLGCRCTLTLRVT